MDTVLSLIFFIGFIVAIYFFIRWIIAKIKRTGGRHYLRNMLVSIGVMVVALTISILAFPPKKTTSATNHEADKSSKSVATSERRSKAKASKKSASSASSTKRSKSAVSKTKVATSKVSSSSVSKKPESSKPEAKPSKKTYDFSKIKLGMSKSEIVKILGKPDSDDSGTLSYGDDYLSLNGNGKLFSGSPRAIQNQIDANIKDKKAAAKKQTVKADHLKSFAKVFGQKDVETLQKYVGSAYSSTETPQGMAYGWKTDYGMLYRIDVTSTGITHVYKDGLGTDDGGTQLYVGQTIKQKAKNYYFNNY